MQNCHLCKKSGNQKQYKRHDENDIDSGNTLYLSDSQCQNFVVYVHYKCLLDCFDEKGNNFGNCEICSKKLSICYDSGRWDLGMKAKLSISISSNIMFFMTWYLCILVSYTGWNISALTMIIQFWSTRCFSLKSKKNWERLQSSYILLILFDLITLVLVDYFFSIIGIDIQNQSFFTLLPLHLVCIWIHFKCIKGTRCYMEEILAFNNQGNLVRNEDNPISEEICTSFDSEVASE